MKNMPSNKFIILFLTITILIHFSAGCIENYESFRITDVSLSKDASKLLSCDSSGIIQLWSVSNGENLAEMNGPIGTSYNIFKWNPDGSEFAIKNARNNIVIYDSVYIKEIKDFSNGTNIRYFNWINNGESFIIINNSALSVWNTSSYMNIYSIPFTLKFVSLSVSQDGKRIVYIPSSGNEIKTMDIFNNTNESSLERIGRNTSEIEACYSLSWSENGNKIAMLVGFKDDEVFNLYVWDTQSNLLIYNQTFPQKLNTVVAFSPDCNQFVYGGSDEQLIKFVNTSSASSISSLNFSESGTSSIDWSLDGSSIALGDYEGIIKVLNVGSGEIIQSMKAPKHYTPFLNVFFVLLIVIVYCLFVNIGKNWRH